MSTTTALTTQWDNPSDIFALLLLLGGDVVQKAIGQLAGVRFHLFKRSIRITPVAFSFGWAAFAFLALINTVGINRLMPEPETPLTVINCENGFARSNRSWVLDRLVRDYQARLEAKMENEAPDDSQGKRRGLSLRVDVYKAKAIDEHQGPRIDFTWVTGCIVIVIQQVLAAVPWIVWGDWGIFLVTVSGTFICLITAGLPQWTSEKWPAQPIDKGKGKLIALTRGNGTLFVMIVICRTGAWDLEAMASSRSAARTETRWFTFIFSILWTILLITVTALKDHTWFLVAIGGLGMIQNSLAAGVQLRPEHSNIYLEPCEPITGYRADRAAKREAAQHDDSNSDEELDQTRLFDPISSADVADVMGTLIQLEKLYPGAGCSLIPTFFPGSQKYEAMRLKFNKDKKFWKSAYRTINKRRLDMKERYLNN